MQKDFYSTYFEVEKTHWLMKGRRAIVLGMLRRYAPQAKTVLDFGCGSGLTVETVAGKGYEASGVDFSNEAIDFGTQKGIKNLTAVSGEQLSASDNSFDAVLCMDVLEHLKDETMALSEIRRVLKPGGAFIIMVPAYMFLWGRQDEVAQHFRRYTMGRMVERLLQSGSYAIQKRSYFNTFLFPLVALVRVGTWVLNVNSKRESDFDLNNRLVNAVFSFVFAIERWFLKHINMPFGVSILIVARNDK